MDMGQDRSNDKRRLISPSLLGGMILSALLFFFFSSPCSVSAALTWTATAAPAIQNIGYANNTITFSSVNIGTPSSDRIVVVGVLNSQSKPPATLTVGSIPATLATSTSEGDASIWYAPVPTGTTASIVSTLGNNVAWGIGGIQVGTLTGANFTPSSFGATNSSYPTPPVTVTATVPSGGVGIVFGFDGFGSGTAPLPSWTNATGDSYTNDTSDFYQVFLAHTYSSGSQTPSLTSGNATSYNGYIGMVMGTWAAGTPATTLHVDGAPEEGLASGTDTISNTTGLTTASAGDIILVWVHAEWNSGTTNGVISGINDTADLMWYKRASTAFTDTSYPSYNDLELWWAYAPSALSSDTITPTFTKPGGNNFDDATIVVSAVTGFSGTQYETSPWDSNSSLPAINNSIAASTVPSVSNISTASANDMLVGFFGNTQGNSLFNPGTGFTFLASSVNPGGGNYSEVGAEFQDVFSTQSSITAYFGSQTVSNATAMIVDALTESPSSATTGRIIRLRGGIRLKGGVRLE